MSVNTTALCLATCLRHALVNARRKSECDDRVHVLVWPEVEINTCVCIPLQPACGTTPWDASPPTTVLDDDFLMRLSVTAPSNPPCTRTACYRVQQYLLIKKDQVIRIVSTNFYFYLVEQSTQQTRLDLRLVTRAKQCARIVMRLAQHGQS